MLMSSTNVIVLRISSIIAIRGLGTTSPQTWQANVSGRGGQASRKVNGLSDADMLPAIIPNTNIYYFTWSSGYVENAPVSRILDVADVLLGAIQRLRDQVQFTANDFSSS